MKKRVFALMLVFALLLGLLPASAAAVIKVNDINIMVNNRIFQPLDAAGQPVRVFEYNGTTYAPLRALAEAYGLNVGYSDSLRCAYVFEDVEPDLSGVSASDAAEIVPVATSGKLQLIVKPINIVVNGAVFKPTDVNGNAVAVFETGGTTYAPLRALAEAYGLVVGYNAERRLAYVTRPGEEPEFIDVPAGASLVADKLDPAEYAIEYDEYTIPCLAAFSGGRIGGIAERLKNGQLRAYLYSINANSEILFEYIDLLMNEFGFVVTDSTIIDLEERTFSGNWALTMDSTLVRANKTVGGDLPLYTPSHIKFSGMHGEIEVSPAFTMRDTGHRWSGAEPNTNNEITGERSQDAFFLKDGQIYNSSDELLSVPANTHTAYELKDGQDTYTAYSGMATIIINGSEIVTVPAVIELDEYSVGWTEDYPRYEVRIADFLSGVYDEQYELCLPTYVHSGHVFTATDFGSNKNASRSDYYSFGNTFIVTDGNGKEEYIGLVPSVRVFNWDGTGATDSVLYIHLSGDYDFEILVSAPVNDTENLELTVAGGNNHTLAVGDTITLEMDGRYVFMPNYDTYSWTVAAGDAVEIVSAAGDSCTIRAVKSGVARVQCLRQYGVDESDVLTGIDRNVNRSESESYSITVE